MRVCSVPECGKKHIAKGFCSPHYESWVRHGDPLLGKRASREVLRFFHNVVLPYEGNECLTWPYNKNNKGYGQMRFEGRYGGVSRFLCEKTYGPPPTPKHEAAHSCGNGHLGCVTKGHLSWKTHTENMADKLIHGTHSRGENNVVAKLSEKQAREILSLKGKEPQRETAARYGIAESTVSNIQIGARWNWLSQAEGRV